MGQTISRFISNDTPKIDSQDIKVNQLENIEDLKINELEKGMYYDFLEKYNKLLDFTK
jgi:hypothetical protein